MYQNTSFASNFSHTSSKTILATLRTQLRFTWTESNFCNPNGTLKQSIDGLCECKETVFGSHCDECKLSYFNLNENGCSKCFCFAGHHLADQMNANAFTKLLNIGSSSLNEQAKCDLAVRLISTRIEANPGTETNSTWPLIEFNLNPNRFADSNALSNDEDSIEVDNLVEEKHFQYLNSTRRTNYVEFVSDELYDDRVFYWILDHRFRGNKLMNSYNHKFRLKLFYSILRGDVSAQTVNYFKHWPDLIIASRIGEHRIRIGSKWLNYENELESDRIVLLERVFNEQNWFQLDPNSNQLTVDRPIDIAFFKLVLMNIEHFLVRAKYHTDQIESRLYQVQLEQSLLPSNSSELNTQLSHKHSIDAIKANCTCLEPFTGLDCSQCKSGYFIAIHYKNKLTKRFKKQFLLECKPCPCNGQVCAANGDCLCDHSTQGEHCEQCRSGYFGNPLIGVRCEKCDDDQPNSIQHCSPCKDGFTSDLNFSNDNRSANDTSGLNECKPCNCSEVGSFGYICHKSTGQCQCKENFIGLKCDKCRNGFRLTANGCQQERCWLNEQSPHNVCIARLADSIDELSFEREFDTVNLDAIKQRPWRLLNDLEAKYVQLNRKSELLFERQQLIEKLGAEFSMHGLDQQHESTSDDIFESLNKRWIAIRSNVDTLIRSLTVETSGELLKRGESTFEKLISFREDINSQIDQLISLKYQRLFTGLETKKFYQDEFVLLKRMKKEFKEDYFLRQLDVSKRQVTESDELYRNVSNLNEKILMNKSEIIDQFDRLFRVESRLGEIRNYVANDLELKLDFVSQLIKRLYNQFGRIERTRSDVDDERVQLEQAIVDANYMNNISSTIANKLSEGYFEFRNKLDYFNRKMNDGPSASSGRLNAENEVKYVQICEIHLSNLRSDSDYIERSFNEHMNKEIVGDLMLNQTNAINQIQLNLNQLKDIDLYLENLFSEFEQLNLHSRTVKMVENKSNQLVEFTNAINLNLMAIANRLEWTRQRIETVRNNTFLMNELDSNVEFRNELLMSVEQDLNSLTKKAIIFKYMDNLTISPAIEIKIFEHELTLSYLTKQLIPAYTRRLGDLKRDLNLQTLDANLEEQIQQINGNIETKKRYVDSFELRNEKIDLINQQTEQVKAKIYNQIHQANKFLSSIKINLGIKHGDCRRTIRLNHLEEASSHVEIEFYYSIGHSNDVMNEHLNSQTNNHTILIVGSPDREFILFELENRQVKVVCQIGARSQLVNPLKLDKNDEHFKYKDAYYRIQFTRIAQQATLIVSSFSNNESIVTKSDDGDLIMKFDNRLQLGDLFGSLAKQSTEQLTTVRTTERSNNERFLSTISDLKINKQAIGLWNFESTTEACIPIKDVLLNDANQSELYVFNGQSSYLQLKQINRYDKHKYTIRIEFRTFSPNGLLLASFNEINGDLILIRLQNGQLQLVIQTRHLQLNLQTQNVYDNGSSYTVIVEREDYFAMLTTDLEQLEGHLKIVNSTDDFNGLLAFNKLANGGSNRPNDDSNDSINYSNNLELDLENSPVFVGGLPSDSADLFAFQPFYGCIKQIQIETALINLNNQNSFGVHGTSSSDANLIRQINFNSADSYIKFNNLTLCKAWTNFGFTFRTLLSNCSILSLNTDRMLNDRTNQTVGG